MGVISVFLCSEKGIKLISLNLNYQPKVLVGTEGLTEEEWLNYRRKGIGGPDAAAIVGQSPFCTKRDLYHDKLGIKSVLEEEESNWVAKEVGYRLEGLVTQISSAKTGFTVFPIRKMFRHPLYLFMVTDVDFFTEFPDGTFGVLECRTTNYHCQDKWASNSAPTDYEYQERHYMSVVNLNVMYLVYLYGNNEDEFTIRRMDRDLDSETDPIAKEGDFWIENILKRTEPPYVEKPDLVPESVRRFYGPAELNNGTIKLGGSYLSFVERYLGLKDKKNEIDAEAKRLETEMKTVYCKVVEAMSVNCKAHLQGTAESYIISYNPVYQTGIDKKNLERLKLHHPDIYDNYVTVSESRRFSVKRGAA